MNITKLKRRFVTLIEMMIVMFLIALITGVIAYNYRGTLEEGKAFKTKAGIEKLETILSLRASDDPDLLDDIQSKWQDVIKTSPLVHSPSALIKDGWGGEYEVEVDDGEIKVRSQKYEDYKRSNPTMFGEDK